ncbi:peptide MFS transporter [Sphingomonas abietis]|uniref:Peptide MFS transporter n=1 Tax=Sphingomonas abietis TaxID=3012344 RepID=A0ABY7NK11_9SPHN|nr:peptide MFS transporter [Sphingomonas abietis]WBO21587.1 peptide MFS transporter [Sphingomonas abietis]
MSTADAPAIPALEYQSDRAFLGHPRGLGYLSFAEAWERFSYYGMATLLALYGKYQLFQPGHIERIWGFGGFRAMLEGHYGPLSPLTMGGAIAGLYGGFVYLTPIAGGIIADRWIGRTRAVTIGAVLMAFGHFCMAFDQTFLIALACLLVGVGLFKGNIAAQVGDLYAPGDLRRADAFQIYMIGIQISVVAAPLVCGGLGQKVAWHFGFGAAGVGMLIGLIVYLSGRRWLPAEPARIAGSLAEPRPKLVAGEGKRIAVLALLVPVLAFTAVGNQQLFAAYELWGDAHYQLRFFGWEMPSTFLISFDAAMSFVTMVGSVAFWRWWATRRKEPDELTKLTIGSIIATLAPATLALASLHEAATGEKVSFAWAVAFHFFNDVGFANIFPVGLALYSRASPKAIGSTMMAVYYLNLFIAGLIVAQLATLLDRMSGFEFWGLHAVLMAAAVVVLLVVRGVAGRLLAPAIDPESPATA